MELIESFVEDIFNRHDLSAIEKYFAKENPSIGHGSAGFKQSLIDLFKPFPDIHANIEHTVEENDLVVVFLNFTGTHKGEFHGLQPTNKSVNIRSADLYRMVNELIAEHWDVVDQLDLLHQTGAINFK
jgi:predicted ester cyclase